MRRLIRHLTYANVAATLALVIAIAGSTGALAGSKKNTKTNVDITKKGAIRAGHVTTAKLADGAVITSKLADASVSQGKLTAIDIVHTTGTTSVTATCPGGERLVSGGAGSLDNTAPLFNSFPNGSNGWTASNLALSAVEAYALCLR